MMYISFIIVFVVVFSVTMLLMNEVMDYFHQKQTERLIKELDEEIDKIAKDVLERCKEK